MNIVIIGNVKRVSVMSMFIEGIPSKHELKEKDLNKEKNMPVKFVNRKDGLD